MGGKKVFEADLAFFMYLKSVYSRYSWVTRSTKANKECGGGGRKERGSCSKFEVPASLKRVQIKSSPHEAARRSHPAREIVFRFGNMTESNLPPWKTNASVELAHLGSSCRRSMFRVRMRRALTTRSNNASTIPETSANRQA